LCWSEKGKNKKICYVPFVVTEETEKIHYQQVVKNKEMRVCFAHRWLMNSRFSSLPRRRWKWTCKGVANENKVAKNGWFITLTIIFDSKKSLFIFLFLNYYYYQLTVLFPFNEKKKIVAVHLYFHIWDIVIYFFPQYFHYCSFCFWKLILSLK
jgi:hypothetical protein